MLCPRHAGELSHVTTLIDHVTTLISHVHTVQLRVMHHVTTNRSAGKHNFVYISATGKAKFKLRALLGMLTESHDIM